MKLHRLMFLIVLLWPGQVFAEQHSANLTPPPQGVMVVAESDLARVYINQRVIITTYLIHARDVEIDNILLNNYPQLGDFLQNIYMKLERATPAREIKIGNTTYIKRAIQNFPVQPTKTGQLAMPTFNYKVIIVRAGKRVELQRETGPQSLTVVPLPDAGKPSPFSNIVGHFKITARVKDRQVATGKKGEVWLFVETDTIEGLHLPALPLSTEARITGPAVIDVNTDQERSKIVAFIKAEIVRDRPGQFIFPAILTSYFDVREGRYRVASTPALALDFVGPAVADEDAPLVEYHLLFYVVPGLLLLAGSAWYVIYRRNRI